MNRFSKIAAFVTLCACMMGAHVSATAQESALPTDTVNGKVVYRYRVQKSEGLYRISKNFGVSQQELLDLNPELKTNVLKLDQVLLIPVVEKIDSTQYQVHVLQPKETLYSISRLYNVPVKELERLNPETSVTMRIGEQLLIQKLDASAKIPGKLDKPTKLEPPTKKEDEPKMLELQQPMELPKPTEVQQPLELQQPLDLQKPLELQKPVPSVTAIPLRLAYMLPLMTDATKRDATMDRFVDFYLGAMLAIYEAQEQGQRFDIYTYDVQKSDVTVQHILQRPELQNVDAIIGPAYPAQVNYAGLYAKQKRVPMLIPFTSKVSGLDHNPYLIQFNPSAEVEAAALLAHLSAKKDSIRFVLIDPKANDVPASTKALHKALQEDNWETVACTIEGILNDSLAAMLSKDKENILVFNSEKYSSVQVLMPKILEQKQGRQMTLLGHYSWAQENVVIPMIYPSVFHSTEPTAMAAYEALYQRFYGKMELSSHAPRYDLLGYDLTRCLIRTLQQSEHANTQDERDRIYAQPAKGLQSDCSFVRVGDNGGRQNLSVEVIRK